MSASAAMSRMSPSREIPLLNIRSNSAWRNGGAHLFLTTLTRVRLPMATVPSLIWPMRRTSIRTDA